MGAKSRIRCGWNSQVARRAHCQTVPHQYANRAHRPRRITDSTHGPWLSAAGLITRTHCLLSYHNRKHSIGVWTVSSYHNAASEFAFFLVCVFAHAKESTVAALALRLSNGSAHVAGRARSEERSEGVLELHRCLADCAATFPSKEWKRGVDMGLCWRAHA